MPEGCDLLNIASVGRTPHHYKYSRCRQMNTYSGILQERQLTVRVMAGKWDQKCSAKSPKLGK